MRIPEIRAFVASLAAVAAFGAPVATVAVAVAGSSATDPALTTLATGDGSNHDDEPDHSSWD